MGIGNIRTALVAAIKSMTVENGYAFDWSVGTVNPPRSDWNAVPDDKYPVADFFFEDEECENGEENTQTISNILTVMIDAIPKKRSVTAENVDAAIDDFKRLVGNNFNLSQSCFFWWYERAERYRNESSFPEYMVRLTFKIRYRQDRKNP